MLARPPLPQIGAVKPFFCNPQQSVTGAVTAVPRRTPTPTAATSSRRNCRGEKNDYRYFYFTPPGLVWNTRYIGLYLSRGALLAAVEFFVEVWARYRLTPVSSKTLLAAVFYLGG